VQMGDGCELDVQSAAVFAQRDEELSYWQLQVLTSIASTVFQKLHADRGARYIPWQLAHGSAEG
jgi:hypothetical protein